MPWRSAIPAAVIGVLAAACASSDMIHFAVDSRPQGLQVDVNGVNVGKTPTSVELQCSKRWVGVMNAPGGWAYDGAVYEITAYPSREAPGLSQTKRVNACQARKSRGSMFFDVGLESVTPKQRIDLDMDVDVSSDTAETLRSLKRLRDQGLLSEREYREKVDQALE